MEQWKDVIGYEGLYQVSDQGRVKRVKGKDSIGRPRPEKILKPSRSQSTGKGYSQVNLSKNGKIKSGRIHVMMAEAFLDMDTSSGVGFKDGDTSNLSLDNLVALDGAPGNRDHQVDKNKVLAAAEMLQDITIKKRDIEEALNTHNRFIDKVNRGYGGHKLEG